MDDEEFVNGTVMPESKSEKIALFGMIGVLVIFASALILLFIPPGGLTRLENGSAFMPIDLDERTWYAKRGFSEINSIGFNIDSPEVFQISSFPIQLNKIFSIPNGFSVNEFTLMTTFECTTLCYSNNLSIFLPEVGENWSVYLNGEMIHREIYLNSAENMIIQRSVQRSLIPIPGKVLALGENKLVFRIIGTATPTRYYSGRMPGFSMSNGYQIGSTPNLVSQRLVSNAISWFQIGAYLFFAIFQFSMYYRRREPYNHYFGMFLITCVVYSFVYSNLSFTYTYNTVLIHKFTYAVNLSWPVLIGLSIWSLLYDNKPLPNILKGLIYLLLVMAVLILVSPFSWSELLFNGSLILVLVALAYIIYILISARPRKIHGTKQLLIAGVLVSVLAVIAVLDWMVFRSGFDFTGWIPFLLAIAFMSILIDRFWQVAVDLSESNIKIASMRDDMEQEVISRTSDLREANALLEGQVQQINNLKDDMFKLATYDPLTGLYNRRLLADTLKREFSRSDREKISTGLLMMDIDHFKLINDAFGHLAGDEVLKSFGSHVLANIRQEDSAFRYGGEEFLIILPGASIHDAVIRAEELRKMIERIDFDIEGKHGQVTVSIGVAEYPENGKSMDNVLAKADEALYAAKHAGRNRVEAASEAN